MGRFRKSGKLGTFRRKSTKRQVGAGFFWDSAEEKKEKEVEAARMSKVDERLENEREAKNEHKNKMNTLYTAAGNVNKCESNCEEKIMAFNEAVKAWDGRATTLSHFQDQKFRDRVESAHRRAQEMTRREPKGGRKKTRKYRKKKRSRSRRR